MTDLSDDRSATVIPRSIAVVDDAVYQDMVVEPDQVGLIEDTEAMVVPFSITPEINAEKVVSVRNQLIKSGQLIRGVLLIKNPYEDFMYSIAEDAIETFAIAKYHHLGNLSRLLGAKEVRFIRSNVEQRTDSMKVNSKVKAPVASGSAELSTRVEDKLKDSLEGSLVFSGSAPAIEEAWTYLHGHHLASDQSMRSLVEMRTGINPILSYKMTVSGTRESAANLQSAVSIANVGPAKGIGVDSSFASLVESIRRVDIFTEIGF